MMKTAIVTGAEGFIGSHMVQYLQRRGWNVVRTYGSEGSASFPKLPNLRFELCDLRNGQRVTQVLARYQPTHIFHLAAQSLPTVSWADPVRTFESNIMGSLYLFEAVRHMRRAPVIVSACSSAEYGNVPASAIPVKEEQPLQPLHPYGISKVCLDLLAREYFLDYKIPAVNIRLFNTTGPGKTNDAPSDFVRQLIGIKKGLQPPIIEVGNLLHTAIRLSGVKAEIRPVPRLMRPSDERIIFGSTEKIREDTGWESLLSIEQTLKSMLEYWDGIT